MHSGNLAKGSSRNMNWKSLKLTTSDDETHQDVWDESALRPLCIPGRFYSDKHDLALWLYHSTQTSMIWLCHSTNHLQCVCPVYLMILNLPANIWMNAENVILCGLWVGPIKPIMNLLLNPISQKPFYIRCNDQDQLL